MLKNSFIHYLTKVLIDIMFYVGIIGCILAPFITKRAAEYFGYSSNLVLPTTIVLITSGISALYILWQLKMIFRTLINNNPFVYQNVVYLRKMSVASFIIAIIYTVKFTFWFTIATAIIAIIFMIAGLFCLTLKDVFKQAVLYKEENDLTV